VGLERGRAVWADHPEILEAVVRGDPVYVIEDQGHRAPLPSLVLSTKLTLSVLKSGLEQPLFEVPTVVGGSLYENLVEADR
jgi:hypothetical protein